MTKLNSKQQVMAFVALLSNKTWLVGLNALFRLTSEIAPESMQLTVFCPTPLPKLRMTNTGKTARYVW